MAEHLHEFRNEEKGFPEALNPFKKPKRARQVPQSSSLSLPSARTHGRPNNKAGTGGESSYKIPVKLYLHPGHCGASAALKPSSSIPTVWDVESIPAVLFPRAGWNPLEKSVCRNGFGDISLCWFLTRTPCERPCSLQSTGPRVSRRNESTQGGEKGKAGSSQGRSGTVSMGWE